MEYCGLRIAKSILFRIFGIGYGILILSWLLLLPMKAHWYGLIATQWQIHNTEFLDIVVVSFFTLAKFVLIFYALVPALAICWTLRTLEKNKL